MDVELVESETTVQVSPALKDLIPRFMENRERDLHALRSAIEDHDYAAVESLGHAMKGTGGGYGFDAITEIGRELEDRARARDRLSILTAVDHLEAYLSRIEIVFG